MTDEPDTVEKVEQTERGYRLTVKSTRGTGTRDQDKVEASARAETREAVEADAEPLEELVRETMEKRRAHQPDETEGDSE